ncbi:putative aminoglycoside phosphotransferase [Sulfurimonas gotlandica GD1]|jgi:homoserine kinase type II|uniref:Putative aminoglycoside phosphotransferase n=2 Tax=Sulfurimonas TaxID=202746 RepID=B6BH72_SULGG|nr:Phosphotransferase enzyme family, putative [Sulfurimonas gotlandica GD1]EHP29861.1 putative aminoglycoside phosphotransferase [Sulfurimonas gotlandica GD1]
MGVKTQLSLHELNQLFPSYGFTEIKPTISGIIDTTYIIHNETTGYILKRYERDITRKIELDIKLLNELKSVGLNVPACLDSNYGWYIYEKLEGKQPTNTKSYHIQALGRFLAKMHSQTSKMRCDSNRIIEDEVTQSLKYVKENFFAYYKRFEFLKNFTHKHEAIIHGDIFKDNTIFNGRKIGVIDFIDSSCGTFAYDVAVTLVGFDARERHDYYINLFLKNYNQHAPKKLSKKVVKEKMKFAANFFALKRVHEYKNTSRAKELLK